MTFGSQFNGYEYDPGLFSGEYIGFENLSYFDLAGGITWMLVPKDQLNFYMGLAFHHLNSPDQSFTGLTSDNLYAKTTETWVHRYRLAPEMHFWCPLSWP